jgi:hypothetical protein
VSRLLGPSGRGQGLDLEASEMAIRAAMHKAGGVCLGQVVNADGGGYRGATIACGQGHAGEFVDYRWKQLLTVLGQVTVRRAYYYCGSCQCGLIPKDRELDIMGSSFSPGVRRMMGHVGAKEPFVEGSEDLEKLAGIKVRTKAVERVAEALGAQIEEVNQHLQEQAIADQVVVPLKSVPKFYVSYDGTGVPVTGREREGRSGKGAHGEAHTREAKLGCVFTQTTVNEKGYPVRDEAATSYVGAIEVAETFGWRIYAEALRRGLRRAAQVIVIGDGAPWIWNIADEHFPGAVQIVDLYHAREHLSDLSKTVYGAETVLAKQWCAARRNELDQGAVEALLSSLRRLRPKALPVTEAVRKEINYFATNQERMRYAKFRAQGLFVGSGVIEAGCRTIVGQRLKESGMYWSVRGANAIIALRCAELSGRLEDFWAARAAS